MNASILRPLPAALAALAAAGATPALAAQAGGGINVTVNGEVVSFAGQPPVEQFGSVLVPLRGVFEKLGASVAYDPGSKTVLALKGATSVQLRIGSATATVNGQPRQLAQPAQAVNGTTLVPLRFVSQALGADVNWSAPSRTVIITTNGAFAGGNGGGNTGGNDGRYNGGGTGAGANSGARSTLRVSSLTTNASGALRAGQTLRVTLQGTPGGSASFTIPGIEAAQDVPMRETAPGTYVGSLVVPSGLDVKGASVLASIKSGGASSPIIQSGTPLTVDTVGPVLANLSPEPDAAVPPGKPLIYGTFSDAGTGVRRGAARVVVNGQDVTGQATVTGAFFSYRPESPLPPGRNTVAVVLSDMAGNETRREWAFTVAPDLAAVKDVTFSPSGRSLQPGDELTVRATAEPGGQARFGVGGVVKDRPMREESPGVYVGTYTVQRGDTLEKAPVTVTFTSPGGHTVTQTAGTTATIAAGAPTAPRIESPADGASVGGDSVTLAGTAAPNVTVHYQVRYQGTLLILPVGGQVAQGEAQADAQGRWKAADIHLSVPPGVSGLSYTAEVTSVNAAGEASDPASVTFKR